MGSTGSRHTHRGAHLVGGLGAPSLCVSPRVQRAMTVRFLAAKMGFTMYTKTTLIGLGGLCFVIGACSGVPNDAPGSYEKVSDSIAGAAALGAIPAGLPARAMVGLFEGSGKTWMKDSGVPWDMRYQYFTKGWVNNWGWGNYDGKWALDYLRECDAQRFVPVVQYYQ